MELLDTTLREGEQCCGVFFARPVKVELARLLDRLGVDFIEVGHPAAAPSIREAAGDIARLGLRSRLVGHARLKEDEIRLVRDLGLGWVGLFSGINPSSLKRYGLGRSAVLERIRRSVLFAKGLGLSVRFTCEDASRTDAAELAGLYDFVRELGADRVSYADTVGIDTPGRVERLCRQLGEAAFRDLHFHFHNDRGMAPANARKAALLGARCIDVSVLGLGERMGIVPLEEMMRWRSPAYDQPRAGALRSAVSLVASSIDRQRFGRRRFAHKSGIHIHGVCGDPSSYEAGGRFAAGDRRIIVLSKLIGRAGLRMLLARHGYDEDEEGVDRLLGTIKSDELLDLADPGEIAGYFDRCGARRRACTAAS
jgi:isopropylmalate/homocitrate/citramalate synthase